MTTVLAFGAAAAAGALVRLVAQRAVGHLRLPWGTLAVNLTGSFLLGLVATWSAPTATIVGTAGIGALTTYSTFADELVAGWSTARAATVAYGVVSLVGGVGLAWLGLVSGGA